MSQHFDILHRCSHGAIVKLTHREVEVKSKGGNMDKAFEVHMLNEKGQGLAKAIAGEFFGFLCSLEGMCGREGREMAIVRTKLEEACFFAKKAMASDKVNQQ
jgi:hypothetical protein